MGAQAGRVGWEGQVGVGHGEWAGLVGVGEWVRP